MKVLLTGANGQLGHCFKDIFPSDWVLIATDHHELDITDTVAVDKYIAKHQPTVIVNAAAYTAVDKAEVECELANKVNVLGPKNLAQSAYKYGVQFFHISTDYVFDGSKNSPYEETDVTNPINVYGKTKREGEIQVMEAYPQAIIIRTSWVFSEYGNNFVKTMLKLAKTKSELSVVNDQIGNPTYAGDIAKLIITFIEKNVDSGIYHYCGDESTSWYFFAKKILHNALGQGVLANIPNIIPVDTKSFPTKAKRPLYSVLSLNKLKQYYLSGSNWNEQLKYCISRI